MCWFDPFQGSQPVRDLENFSVSCGEGPPMAGFSREGILRGDRFSANPTEIGRYSPAVVQNIPVFSEPWPETGSIALSAGQNGKDFRS